jgi:hypothetical protein
MQQIFIALQGTSSTQALTEKGDGCVLVMPTDEVPEARFTYCGNRRRNGRMPL